MMGPILPLQAWRRSINSHRNDGEGRVSVALAMGRSRLDSFAVVRRCVRNLIDIPLIDRFR